MRKVWVAGGGLNFYFKTAVLGVADVLALIDGANEVSHDLGEPVGKGADFGLLAFRAQVHPSVVEIFHVPAHVVAFGSFRGFPSESDALDAPGIPDLQSVILRIHAPFYICGIRCGQ